MTNKRFNPGAAKAAALKKGQEPLIEPTETDTMSSDFDTVDEPIEPTEIGSQNQPPLSDLDQTCVEIIQSLKDFQDQALLDLETQIAILSEDFTDRATAIVRRGTQACFLEAAARIRELKLSDLMTRSGQPLKGTINTIARPGTITDGVTE